MSDINKNYNCQRQCQCQRQGHRECQHKCRQKKDDPIKVDKNPYEIQYLLCSDRLLINDTMYIELLYFPWATDTTKKMTNGMITFSAKIDNTSWFQVQVFNNTTSRVIGTSAIIKSSGVHKFNFTIPTTDSQLSIRFKRINGIGEDPQVLGMQLDYHVSLI